MKTLKLTDYYDLYYIKTVLDVICTDLKIVLDEYDTNINMIDTKNVCNESTVLITLTKSSNVRNMNTEKYTLICDDFNTNTFYTFKVFSDNSNDVVLYVFDTDFESTYFDRKEILKSSV